MRMTEIIRITFRLPEELDELISFEKENDLSEWKQDELSVGTIYERVRHFTNRNVGEKNDEQSEDD